MKAEIPESDQSPAGSTGPKPAKRGSSLARRFREVVTFDRMEVVSLTHSLIYTGLLISAFLLGGPQPLTFILGLCHGLLWIGMSITSLLALRLGVINLKLAVAITLLGCVAPFFGSLEFIRQNRKRERFAE